jgi:hypothetical protein
MADGVLMSAATFDKQMQNMSLSNELYIYLWQLSTAVAAIKADPTIMANIINLAPITSTTTFGEMRFD